MPQAPDRFQPAPTTQPGIGFAAQPHPFWKALEGVVRGLQMSQGSTNPWGMHEPTLTSSQAVGPAAQGAANVMNDPRNAWMGLGGAVGMAKLPKKAKEAFHIIDRHTGEIVGRAQSFKHAIHKVDKLDNEYGGYRYTHKRIEDEAPSGMPPAMGTTPVQPTYLPKSTTDTGGFGASSMGMRAAMNMPRPNTRVGASGNEPQVRAMYQDGLEQGHRLAEILTDFKHPLYKPAVEFYQNLPLNSKEDVNKIIGGKIDLQNEVMKSMNGTNGGGQSPLGYGQ